MTTVLSGVSATEVIVEVGIQQPVSPGRQKCRQAKATGSGRALTCPARNKEATRVVREV